MEDGRRRRKRPKSPPVKTIARMAEDISLSEQRPHRIDQVDEEIKMTKSGMMNGFNCNNLRLRGPVHERLLGPNYVCVPDEGY